MKKFYRYVFVLACPFAVAAPPGGYAQELTPTAEDNAMKIQSSAFVPQGQIPKLYTCDGDNISPPMQWSDLPPSTVSLVLIVDDPDAPDPKAPKMTWVHWVLYNLPTSTPGLAENAAASQLPAGTLQGRNDWKQTGYRGPCPPLGRHRYFHKLYALDITLPDLDEPNKADLEKAMQGHVLGYGELIGTYQR